MILRAFRWASDRIAQCSDGGIVAFISNGSWLDGNAQDGMRKCLEQEFDKIYIYNLRGNARTCGELSRKEGGKIFGSGSRTPIAITILVKKGEQKLKKCEAYAKKVSLECLASCKKVYLCRRKSYTKMYE